ncbi:SIR2 family protein [Pseudomonas viridiflava]|uniref:SIR2 family protein n=1 Tax=Pseudomonas viridiflava TaxID=33069 RepID=UPI000F0686A8|nr:SIR2 family protein [Pseudomonas viridiflava]
MSIRFSAEGPAFPETLVDALLAGEVVFLCGAGVSAPQLPGFGDLVQQCFDRLNLEQSVSELASSKAGRFEEVLGSLSRRIVNPRDMTRALVNILQAPTPPDFTNHNTILRLSRDLDNHPLIVTTNFDTMLEKALHSADGVVNIQELSFAGQDLPAPGSADFRGIIHLHGRIADDTVGLHQTPLVVTSADYGDAYMRSGWASRFLFDLCRCKTVVLVGYSAGDAPVRYFLNVLEADRERFPDLRPVYALDAIEARDGSDARWEALAVEPIGYEKTVDSVTGRRGHRALWDDLAQLAELVERPRSTRQTWATAILSQPYASMSPAELDKVCWLFIGKNDLSSIAITSIKDSAWIDFFLARKLWSEDQAPWILAAWLALDLESRDRYSLALKWMKKIGKALAIALANRVDHVNELSDLWTRAWLLLVSNPSCTDRMESELQIYSLQKRLGGAVVLHSDLLAAVDLITPVLTLDGARTFRPGQEKAEEPELITDLIRPSFDLRDSGGAAELVDALLTHSQPALLMKLATAKLRDLVASSVDCGALETEYDINDSAVPSVEPHMQNEHHDGPMLLVKLIAGLLPKVAETDRDAVRQIVDEWRYVPGMLAIRLWLHAHRNAAIYSADEAIRGINALPLTQFWQVKRELLLLMRERLADASKVLALELEMRVLTEGEMFFARYTIDSGQTDWRGHARDSDVWLRLKMFEAAGALSDAGAKELYAIMLRRDYLDREVEERDFFRYYSSGVRTIIGDAQPIMAADSEQRLEIAQAVMQSFDIEKRMGWSAYCGDDPEGAFDTLKNAPLEEVNAPLWNDLISALTFPPSTNAETTSELMVRVFQRMEHAESGFLALVIERLATLYTFVPRQTSIDLSTWWQRLFAIAVDQDLEPLEEGGRLYERAINSSAGRLAGALLFDIEAARQTLGAISENHLRAMVIAARAEGRQGTFARAIFVNSLAFVLSVANDEICTSLDATLGEATVTGRGLRAVLVNQRRTSISVSRRFSAHILRGLLEVGASNHDTTAAAAKIMTPALSIIREELDVSACGITLTDVANTLRNCSAALREGVVELLALWVTDIEGGPAEAWRTNIGPLLERVWPRERVLRESTLTRHFTNLVIMSGEAFPEALSQLLPYITQVQERERIPALERSKCPESFPRETLTLLWRLYGPGSTHNLYGIHKILERLIAVQPTIEFDRRLQSLHFRADR